MLKHADPSLSRSASTDGVRPSRPNLLPPILTIDSDDVECLSPALKRAFSASYLYEYTSPSTTPPFVPGTSPSGEIECPLPRKSFPDITVLNDRRVPLSLSMSSLSLSIDLMNSSGVRGEGASQHLTPAHALTALATRKQQQLHHLHQQQQQQQQQKQQQKEQQQHQNQRGMFFLENDDAESDCEELEAFRTASTPEPVHHRKTPSNASHHRRISSVKVSKLLRNPSLPLFVKLQDVQSNSDEPKTEPSSPNGESSPLAEACAEFLEIVKNPPPVDYNTLVSPLTEQSLACWVEEQRQRLTAA